ncbi:MAG: SdiA-regulated domain-containing protein [Pseudomonas sp.]|uniref:SdiA-regulated domain-containing protein n=1 Tax=Pseudomonas sp. TaxID=306 RepID=UPI002719EAF5|nr:SdiA-regulated domain-containing protein [Pseudomonas sp.]MDO9616391.1 SdiA-regulated domain-containing protein [Pseudomonas sp.]MDP2445713.1 SdiA-regulated domain-containing protein [Pseudomonas sp.]MDZ4335259.1 SdiA-regulated domain-containing protein [Pseudomonas sp.]
MRDHFTLKRLLLSLVVLALLLLGLFAQEYRLFERAWFNVQQAGKGPSAERDILLSGYQVDIEAKVIEGLNDDVSALTYDPDRNSLFTVTNQKAQLIELSLDGELLRRIDLHGFGDAEAVEYISQGLYVISDERQQRLIKVRVDDATTELHADQAQQFSLGIGLNGNKGFEGLAYDSVGQRLFVAKERDPIRIYEIHGFPQRDPQRPFAVHVVDDQQRDAGLFVRDLSSLQFDERSGHLLALSDESRLVLELNVEGKPISSLSLLAGRNGLTRSVPQGEGIAMDNQGVLYLVSEPNLFYRFKKPGA